MKALATTLVLVLANLAAAETWTYDHYGRAVEHAKPVPVETIWLELTDKVPAGNETLYDAYGREVEHGR